MGNMNKLSKQNITGNKGEWSEIYTLIKLLAEGVVHTGDENLQKIQTIFFPIIKIIRYELAIKREYTLEDEIVLIEKEDEKLRIPIKRFKEQANVLLARIKNASKGTFAIPEIEKFMLEINSFSLKAKSTSKSDITLQIHDQHIGSQPILGFSIKSQLGNPSTLLNAGKSTNFVFKIVNQSFGTEQINNINEIKTKSKIKDRISQIKKEGGKLVFQNITHPIFANNLTLIDSELPRIISEMLLDYYTSNRSKVLDLLLKVEDINPLKFDVSNQHQFYSYKIKNILTDIALGMTPAKIWDGQYDATGGYLIVRDDGEIVCYHIYQHNHFQDYLLKNTKFDTASSSRYEFGFIYEKEGDLFFNLNLQIRFLQ